MSFSRRKKLGLDRMTLGMTALGNITLSMEARIVQSLQPLQSIFETLDERLPRAQGSAPTAAPRSSAGKSTST